MTTTFLNRDAKEILKNMFEENDYNINIQNIDLGKMETMSAKDFLNIDFYTWRNRIVDIEEKNQQVPFGNWVESLNKSLNQSYCLVEIINETCQVSPDIDNGVIDCKATFVINSNKINQLEDFLAQLRGIYKGNVQTIKNAYGKSLKAYIYVGALLPVEEPMETQLGETIICECGFSISYLLDAITYTDETLQISLDGDNYEEIILSKDTDQLIYQGQANSKANRPDVSGQIQTSATRVKTITFYCFKTPIMSQLLDMFHNAGASEVWDNNQQQYVSAQRTALNVPIYLKIESGTGESKKGYIYDYCITQMEKVRENCDFTIISITLSTRAYGQIN